MRLKGNNTMILSEEQMIAIVQRWLKSTVDVYGSEVVSVKQSRTTGRFTIEIEEDHDN